MLEAWNFLAELVEVLELIPIIIPIKIAAVFEDLPMNDETCNAPHDIVTTSPAGWRCESLPSLLLISWVMRGCVERVAPLLMVLAGNCLFLPDWKNTKTHPICIRTYLVLVGINHDLLSIYPQYVWSFKETSALQIKPRLLLVCLSDLLSDKLWTYMTALLTAGLVTPAVGLSTGWVSLNLSLFEVK